MTNQLWQLRDHGTPYPNPGSFVALVTYLSNGKPAGGTSARINLGSREINFILGIKGIVDGITVDNSSLKNWAFKFGSGGTIYRPIILGNSQFMSMVLSSAGKNYTPQFIQTDEENGEFYKVVGIPKQNDYSSYTLERMIAEGLGGLAYTIEPNGAYRLSSNGKLFFVPYLCGDTFSTSKGFDGNLWIPKSYFVKEITFNSDPVPSPIPNPQPSPLGSIILPNGKGAISIDNLFTGRTPNTVVHIAKVDANKVKFFVTPNSSRDNVVNFCNRYGLLLAVNGDGFDFNTGIPWGKWISQGRVLKSETTEDTLYIKSGNRVKISGLLPSLSGLNASGFPNILIDNGTINPKLIEDTSIAPRTAIGWSYTQLIFVVADGSESHNIGLTKNELANYIAGLGFKYAINCDGGGSSQMAAQGKLISAMNDEGQLRQVANAWGVY